MLTWIAAVLAIIAGVGLVLDLVLAGTDSAVELAGLIVGFCEMVAFVLGVAGLAGKKRGAATQGCVQTSEAERDGRDSTEEAAKVQRDQNGKYVVYAQNVSKTQIGDGNTQINGPGRI